MNNNLNKSFSYQPKKGDVNENQHPLHTMPDINHIDIDNNIDKKHDIQISKIVELKQHVEAKKSKVKKETKDEKRARELEENRKKFEDLQKQKVSASEVEPIKPKNVEIKIADKKQGDMKVVNKNNHQLQTVKNDFQNIKKDKDVTVDVKNESNCCKSTVKGIGGGMFGFFGGIVYGTFSGVKDLAKASLRCGNMAVSMFCCCASQQNTQYREGDGGGEQRANENAESNARAEASCKAVWDYQCGPMARNFTSGIVKIAALPVEMGVSTYYGAKSAVDGSKLNDGIGKVSEGIDKCFYPKGDKKIYVSARKH